jgi:hypothetical protein
MKSTSPLIVRVPYSTTSFDVSDIQSLPARQVSKLLLLVRAKDFRTVRAQFSQLSETTLRALESFGGAVNLLANQIEFHLERA